ncbi:HetP family heterocyst commitment protein [Calothrix rhizosoleniae]|uniref:HetP family heterocyst commitment protein n=1 Tax=Calothrix rhizosoleniae TaxID=888997 RepID=UPI000B4A2C0C|nr:HetP family heterocyst commitment protein [Calothrix rhizosoleniae]
MHQNHSGINSKLDQAIHPEQFDQLVEAILAGKYSWACVLMLRFAGYNPLHYIPYRTYNRLLKENSRTKNNQPKQTGNINPISEKNSTNNLSSGCLNKIKDIAYLEVVGKNKNEIRGGHLDQWLSTQVHEYQSIKSELEVGNKQDLSLNYDKFY